MERQALFSGRHFVPVWIGILGFLSLFCHADVPDAFKETVLATGLKRPVALAFLPDGRLLIGEQYTGKIRVYKGGTLLPTPYATVSPVQKSNNETGLLGLSVDPNFSSNGYVYVFVTQSWTKQRIWRYKTVGDTGTSPTVIVDNIPTLGINHNGGGIGFGPDGKLYVSVGENGMMQNDAQKTSSWRGKILRFNPNGTVASGNPWGNAAWCRGLRNPFRFTWQPSTGKLFASENGPNIDDEINLIVPGANYGWPNETGPNSNPAYTDPIYTFATTIAVTDVAFYNGSALPFKGHLFYVDYKFGRIRRLVLGGAGGEEVVAGPINFVTGVEEPVDLEEGPDGALYFCTLPGLLVRVGASGTGGNLAPFASFTVDPTSGPPPLTVVVNAGASTDPDGSIASFQWKWGDGTATGSGLAAVHTYSALGSYTITLKVTDNLGKSSTVTQEVFAVSPGNEPPSAHIESAAPKKGKAPLKVKFKGHGHDTKGPLKLEWDFGDGSPKKIYKKVSPDKNRKPTHKYFTPGAYKATLKVTDPEGISATHSVMITVD